MSVAKDQAKFYTMQKHVLIIGAILLLSVTGGTDAGRGDASRESMQTRY
jgi:hypothetical protein